ncbi:efflux transporter outer membrane subunit [Oecophyllibacter saccharovorans]|nr:efflux transporter outer membrane subunit [Oecophyllibacter saccharovorans]
MTRARTETISFPSPSGYFPHRSPSVKNLLSFLAPPHCQRSLQAPKRAGAVKSLLGGVALLALSACQVGPHYHPPHSWAPRNFVPQTEANAPTPPLSVVVERPFDSDWWKEFHDPLLTSLEERVAVENLNFQMATSALLASRAEMQIAGAERFPFMSAQGTYNYTQNSSRQLQEIIRRIGRDSSMPGPNPFQTMDPNDIKIPLLNQWNYGIDATYEVDLWGRVARQYEAAKAIMKMTQEEQRSVLLAQQADMARDYLTLRGDQKRTQVLAQNHKTLADLLALTENRYRSGLVSEVDVEAVKGSLHDVEAQQASLAQTVSQEKNAIALLLGAPPHSLDSELDRPATIPTVPPYVPIGLPSELAHRRPDIRASEDRLRETVAEVGEAVADFYPKVTINADFGMQTLSFKDLTMWNARAWNVGPSISLPIFQGGRLVGQLRLKKAEQKTAAISYRQTVLKAWNEVDNALKAYRQEQFHRQGLLATTEDEQRRLQLATSQYRSGLATYLDVLDAQSRVQNAEMSLASSDAALADDLARLYNALGGGWESVLPADEDKGGQNRTAPSTRP